MKVLHINCTHYREHFKEMIKSQQELGINSEVLYYTYLKSIKIIKLHNEEEDYVHTMQSNNIFFRSKFLVNLRMNYVWKEILNIGIDFKKFDLLHAHKLFTDGYIARRINLVYGIPYIVTLRNTDINKSFLWRIDYYKKIAIDILENSKSIVFISNTAKEKFRRMVGENLYNDFSSRILVIPNGVDNFWLNNLYYRENYNLNGEIRIVSVGVINKNKNYLSLIHAIKLLCDKNYVIRLTIIGRVEDELYLKELNKYNFVSVIDQKPRDELINYMRAADIFALVSISETFGLVYPEALTQSLPLIYSENQGFDKFYEDGFIGYSVNPKNPVDIADKIVKVIMNYEKIQVSINKIKMDFSWERINTNYKSIYDNYIK